MKRRSPEFIFERLIWRFRLVSVLPVVMSLLGSVNCFLLGTAEEIRAMQGLSHQLSGGHGEHSTELIGTLIGGIDYYVIGIALLIFGYGIYELVISDIDDRNETMPERRRNLLSIDSLDTLKQKLTNVIVVALIVSAFKTMISFPVDSMANLLQFCASVMLLAFSAWLIGRSHGDH
jgi:uncharacterized membrane protein YqhA